MSISDVNAILKLKVTLPKLIQTLTERYSETKGDTGVLKVINNYLKVKLFASTGEGVYF